MTLPTTRPPKKDRKSGKEPDNTETPKLASSTSTVLRNQNFKIQLTCEKQ